MMDGSVFMPGKNSWMQGRLRTGVLGRQGKLWGKFLDCLICLACSNVIHCCTIFPTLL